MNKLYDYTCLSCGHTWEHDQAGWEPEHNAKECPACKATTLRREFPAPAVHAFYSPMHPRHKRGMCGKRTKR